MFIKLNFTSSQTSDIWLESLWIIMNNINSYTSSNSSTNASTFITHVQNSGSASTAIKNVIGGPSNKLDAANSEIINTTTGIMPLLYYYSAGANSSLTFKFKVYDSSTKFSYTQLSLTGFNHSITTSTSTWTAHTYSTSSAPTLDAANSTAVQTWSSSASNANSCYWAYISPTTFSWAANTTSQTRQGWNTAYSGWTNTSQIGPYFSTQYTRLDIWNNDTNGIVPTCWTNGYNATYRPWYGISFAKDIGWGNTIAGYTFNPRSTETSNTTFSVMNTVDATPNTTGIWTLTNGGLKVGFGTNIRNFQDQCSLANSTSNVSGTTAYTWSITTRVTFSKVYNAESGNFRSAFYGYQGISLYSKDSIEWGAVTSTDTRYVRWLNTSNITGSYSLQPMVWNRADFNNIGGLISDKSGIYLFNGDYIAGDEFTATVSGVSTVYSIWPLADGWNNRIGLAVPKK